MKSQLKKIGFILLLVIIIRLLVVVLFNCFNCGTSNYLSIDQGIVSSGEMAAGAANLILLEEKNNEEGSYTFYIEAINQTELMLIYDRNHSPYRLFVNDSLKSQNYNEEASNYEHNVAYTIIDIDESDYRLVGDSFLVEIRLERNQDKYNQPAFYLGEREAIRNFISIRTMYNTLMLISFLIILAVSGFFFYRDRASYMFITLLISVTSFLKCIISGEFYVLSHFIGINSHNFLVCDSLTSIINLLLYQYLIYILYRYKIKRVYLYLYMGLFISLAVSYSFVGNIKAYIVLIIISDIAIISLELIGYIKNKSYSMILVIVYNIFAGFNIFTILKGFNYLKQGNLSSIAYGPQIGSMIYIFGFLLAVTRTYFNKMKEYERQEAEYERITLLRGISHDLKLPISVIKLNSQMLERYEMPIKERKEYVKASLEAAIELQNMTDNINCYLNMGRIITNDDQTSIRDSFMKLKNQYRSQGVLTIKVIEKDYLLSIHPLDFERMIYNLIDNALKYNKENKSIRVSYDIQDNITILIQDSGIGMKQEEVDKIFNPFYRIDVSRNQEGFGLGLSVVQGVVTKLNGKISVESKTGFGTKIIIVIPKNQ